MGILHGPRARFWQHLQHSELLTRPQLRDAVDRYGQEGDAVELARALVQDKLLTPFQARLLLAGRTLGVHLGPYRLLDELGRGAVGRVYRAQHRNSGDVVALKVLAPQVLRGKRAAELFRREATIALRLNHPNIVRALDVGQAGRRCYLVLEYVQGWDLERLMRRRQSVPVRVACEIVRQAADGLQAAHEQGLVHRDIKPSNLMLVPTSPRLTVKILDFGLARWRHPDEESGTLVVGENMVLGTPDYLAPEQAKNANAVDIRADLYSLGCVFYFLLTGKAPFPGGSVLQKLVRHQLKEPQPIEELRPEVPATVTALVGRLLMKKPAGRFQSPAELAAALAPYCAVGREASVVLPSIPA